MSVVMSCRAAGEPVVSSLDPIKDLDALFMKILSICTEQFPVIDSVFTTVACDSVRELLVERLFNDPAFGILSFLDQFFKTRRYTELSSSQAYEDSTSSSPNRDYVRLLCAAYERTCAMVAEIEAIEHTNQLKSHVREAVSNQDYNIDENHSTEPVLAADHERIHTFLNLQLHSLFGSHREKYLQTELDLLQCQFKENLAAMEFPKPPIPSKSKGGTSKVKSAATAATANVSTPSPPASSIQLVSSASTTSISSSNLEKDGQLESSLVFFESLRGLAEDESIPRKYGAVMNEAIERCKIILKGSEMHGELVTKVFTSFVASFGDEYQGVRLIKHLDESYWY